MKNEFKKLKKKNVDIELHPIRETSFFKFYKSSVTWHFVQNSKFQNDTTENNPFSSFETDLLNYQNQKEPPFRTFFKDYNQNAKVIFPSVYKYNSEGQSHTRNTDPERLELSINLSVSHSLIEKSGKTIVHMTLAPAFDEFFSELDLIKLATLFGSKQEETNVNRLIQFKINGEDSVLNPTGLLRIIYGQEKDIEFENLHTGIIQIETYKLDAVHEIDFKDFFKVIQNKNRSEIKSDSLKQFSKALCGIILGIFDFNRMDDEEIFDTIQPIVQAESTFIVLCRGTMFKISDEDEIMESVSNRIIVSPYLLIPNMVLAYNEFILIEAKNEIDLFLDPKQNNGFKELETCQRKVRHILNVQYLRDIFQYPSEKEIVQHGNSQRGISNLYDTIIKRLEELSELIEIKKANRTNRSDAMLNALLGFIAALQLKSIFDDLLNKICPDINVYAFTAVFAFAVAGAIFWFFSMKKK